MSKVQTRLLHRWCLHRRAREVLQKQKKKDGICVIVAREAPIAQRIECLPPEEKIEVQFLLGVFSYPFFFQFFNQFARFF